MQASQSVPAEKHPALLRHEEERLKSLQARVADAVTTFAGSMTFVYVHVIWFILWISIGVEKFPFGLLTMIVSLEAIFLSTFVMISQNRADARRQVLADARGRPCRPRSPQNEQLIALSKQILELHDRHPRDDQRTRHHQARWGCHLRRRGIRSPGAALRFPKPRRKKR